MPMAIVDDAAQAMRSALAEQIAPLVEAHESMFDRWVLAMDLESARRRLREGRVAYDALEVVEQAGPLVVAFRRMTVAIEHAGLASADEATSAREQGADVLPLIAAWLGGEPLPREPSRRVARRAAAVIASSILARASENVREAEGDISGWNKPQCPCCGSLPDFVFTAGGATRMMVCARCDTAWPSDAAGCAGCGATSAPAIVRIAMAALGYDLVICNQCGRYIKESGASGTENLLVERALTADIDAAAERRGLML